MSDKDITIFGIIVCLPVMIVFLSVAIGSARKIDPDHVHTLWFVFSLTFVLATALVIYEDANRVVNQCGRFGLVRCDPSVTTTPHDGPPDEGRLVAIAWSIINSMMGVKDEFVLVGGVLALLLGPQLLSYLISGLFGCGSPPRFVSYTMTIASWSIIKFFAIVAGIQGSLVINTLIEQMRDAGLVSIDEVLESYGVVITLFLSTMFNVTLSFVIMAVYLRLNRVVSGYQDPKFLASLHRFMTRHKRLPEVTG